MRHLPITLATVAALAATAATARANTVSDWNDAASTAIVTVATQPPPVAVMSFAMVQGAVYDAVDAIDGRYRPYLVAPAARRTDSEDAAAATAAFRVLAGLFPAQQATLQTRYDTSLAAIPDGPRKSRWNFWRPITAIREADTDGNPATTADPGWLPLFDPSTPIAAGPPLVTPPFPGNPSGHACATGAVVTALQQFFGRDRVPLTLHSNESATTRHFARLSDWLREVISARVWAGIHFRTADVEGAQLGETVAHYERRHYFGRIRR